MLRHDAELSVLLNQGKCQFAPATASPLPLGMPADAVAVADFDRDKNADLVVPTVARVTPFTSRVAPAPGRR